MTIQAVERNLYLFPAQEEEKRQEEEREDKLLRNTWFLLMHLDRGLHQLRAELSHPTGFDLEHRMSNWSERILLPPFDFDPTTSIPIDDEGLDDGDVTIEFKRRA